MHIKATKITYSSTQALILIGEFRRLVYLRKEYLYNTNSTHIQEKSSVITQKKVLNSENSKRKC